MRILGAVVLLVFWGCGSEDGARPDVGPRDGPCLSCEVDEEEVETERRNATPRLAVEPGALMFYGELGTGSEVPPEEALVVNHTTGSVVITEVHLVDNTQSAYGPGSSQYFTVDGLEGPTVLSPGASLSLWVSFSASTNQKAALLLIETNDPDGEDLVVELSGKYFAPF